MKKLFTKRVKLWLYTIIGFIVGVIIAYSYGTFNPNFIVKNKIIKQLEADHIKVFKDFGFEEPAIEYSNNKEFVLAVGKCIQYINLTIKHEDRVHREIIIAMAVLETGYGKSRFAKEGNNLFGIRTWEPSTPQLKPLGNPDVKWGVKAYKTKCSSVKDMVNNINTHHAYELFRIERAEQLANHTIDLDKQIDLLNKWSTNPIYTTLVKQKVKSVRKILENE
ncbi:MAG: hypothetical protein CMA64_00180 [Euryarchaeota archaeon]|jgi:Bax protein|nr:hypothetical protein [Euryarchaeota archaeon]